MQKILETTATFCEDERAVGTSLGSFEEKLSEFAETAKGESVFI